MFFLIHAALAVVRHGFLLGVHVAPHSVDAHAHIPVGFLALHPRVDVAQGSQVRVTPFAAVGVRSSGCVGGSQSGGQFLHLGLEALDGGQHVLRVGGFVQVHLFRELHQDVYGSASVVVGVLFRVIRGSVRIRVGGFVVLLGRRGGRRLSLGRFIRRLVQLAVLVTLRLGDGRAGLVGRFHVFVLLVISVCLFARIGHRELSPVVGVVGYAQAGQPDRSHHAVVNHFKIRVIVFRAEEHIFPFIHGLVSLGGPFNPGPEHIPFRMQRFHPAERLFKFVLLRGGQAASVGIFQGKIVFQDHQSLGIQPGLVYRVGRIVQGSPQFILHFGRPLAGWLHRKPSGSRHFPQFIGRMGRFVKRYHFHVLNSLLLFSSCVLA